MKKGLIRRVDRLGRIVIPKEVRDAFGIGEGTPLVLSVEGDRLVYTKAESARSVADVLDEAMAALGEQSALDEATETRVRSALAEARSAIGDA